jgi:hypothetical protein
MGEFERSGMGVKRGVVWASEDVFTIANFEIAATARAHWLYCFLISSEEILGKAVHDRWPQEKQQ